MSVFNQHSRTHNVLKSSTAGATCNLAIAVMGFVYRSVFLYFLTESYLGINGLFSNILTILSVSDLGISTAITYRFYDPISKEDIPKVGQLVRFLKKVYLVIACVILLMGMSLYPFLDCFLKDTSEVPAEVNIRLVYILYLFQTLSTYLFSYRQLLVSADQKHYLVAFFNTVLTFTRYVMQLFVLWRWKNFTMTLTVSVLTTILCNILFSLWVTIRYKEVFAIKEDLPKQAQRKIIQDTKATMMHRIGGTVLNATDNIVLSKFVGLAITGIYSNYSMLISSLSNVLHQLLSSFASSIGNAHVSLSKESAYVVYRRLLFLNLWISGMVTACLYSLVNSFICLWVGEKMQLDTSVVGVLCIQFYLIACRKITTSYVDACGLFVKDRIRPLIEAGLNLGISIFLTVKYGIIGVFLGTIISCILTVFWREPYILFKYEFKRPVWDYWNLYFRFALVTFIVSYLLSKLQNLAVMENTVINWILRGFCCVIVYNVVALVAFWSTEELQYYYTIIKKRLFAKKNWIAV